MSARVFNLDFVITLWERREARSILCIKSRKEIVGGIISCDGITFAHFQFIRLIGIACWSALQGYFITFERQQHAIIAQEALYVHFCSFGVTETSFYLSILSISPIGSFRLIETACFCSRRLCIGGCCFHRYTIFLIRVDRITIEVCDINITSIHNIESTWSYYLSCLIFHLISNWLANNYSIFKRNLNRRSCTTTTVRHLYLQHTRITKFNRRWYPTRRLSFEAEVELRLSISNSQIGIVSTKGSQIVINHFRLTTGDTRWQWIYFTPITIRNLRYASPAFVGHILWRYCCIFKELFSNRFVLEIRIDINTSCTSLRVSQIDIITIIDINIRSCIEVIAYREIAC